LRPGQSPPPVRIPIRLRLIVAPPRIPSPRFLAEDEFDYKSIGAAVVSLGVREKRCQGKKVSGTFSRRKGS
jgi:hypothetical protein